MTSADLGHRPFLSLHNAAFRLGDRIVFAGTSWTFHRDEQWAVLGPNGSGKSLLVEALRGRLPVVQGELTYHFRPAPGSSPQDAIGVVAFENRKLDLRDAGVQSRWNSLEEEGALRVRDFLSYERVMDVNPFEVTDRHDRARPAFGRRRDRAVRLLRIRPFLDRTLLSLSNGEMQRVQLARALCHPLRLLILDDPFAGLDGANRAYFRAVLERLMAGSLRVLFITTRPEDVPRHVTHTLYVDGCRVLAAGRRGEVLSRMHVAPEPAVPAGPHRRSRAEAATGEEVVRLRDVTVRYGRQTVLQGVNWTIHAGESWALLGPNGSGKSTLLSLILGDNPQVYNNDVTIFGTPRGSGESIWDIKKRIGWVSPELQLHFDDEATCFEVVASGFHETLGLFELPTPRRRAAVKDALRHFGLLRMAETPLYALSAGVQRMVLLARALVKRPTLLILDEPCQGLDAGHRRFFIHELDKVIRTGEISVVFVTHRPEEIPSSIRRVLRLNAGRARAETRGTAGDETVTVPRPCGRGRRPA